ncbi:glutamate 5-kinase [Hippea maritima]|uniref:Glutamate 5-kinase n=1 Tax=Hippea maritima (strain ATCC 700847 / DSM 10411 / MH2) TaxID=760142 RepID=F2LY01_HIPMA|nr:glutamate 5-kinase [Hippea maritima]AEA33266.1 Glutamate 5-kinase [Hippea maritima DSM 10411]
MDKREFRERLNQARRIVIKIGSGVISNNGSVDKNTLKSIVEDIANLKNRKKQILIVSSGAVASGMGIMGVKKRPDNIVNLQALASLGQPELINIYKELFEGFGIKTSQILITVDDIQNRRRFINAKNTLLTLLKWDILPIINENDTVVIKELRFGDNDNLSYHILNLIEADALVILSTIDGLYTKNPQDSKAQFIEAIDETVNFEDNGKSLLGSGGIKTKIEAGLNAAKLGKLACIINGKTPNAIKQLFNDSEFRFSYFIPKTHTINSKKSWIINCMPAGVVVIDEGAEKNILNNKSLLPSGIKKVYGGFGRGDVINIENEEGDLVAKGITNYDSSEIERIKQQHSNEIVNILGYKYSNDVVHIDNMALTKYHSEE